MSDENKQKIVKSSLIQAYSYDPHEMTLSITFQDGTEIDYFKVPPPEMSKVFDTPGSVGSKFRKLIAHKYQWQKTS